MKDLTQEQQLKFLDLIETFVDQQSIPSHLLDDLMVLYRFLLLSKDRSELVFDFVSLLSISQMSQLTLQDILTEEVILELHLLHGFDHLTLVQWLRAIDYGGNHFFESISREKEVLHIDQIMERASLQLIQIKGVQIESVLTHFKSFDRLIDDVMNQRVEFKQFRQLMVKLKPDDELLKPIIDDMIKNQRVLDKITQTSQVLRFRVFCSFFDFLEDKKQYLTGIANVFDQLLVSSTLDKTFHLLNQMPYPIIRFILERLIQQGTPHIITHLNDKLPQFEYGIIRKIVRRNSLGLNYKYE